MHKQAAAAIEEHMTVPSCDTDTSESKASHLRLRSPPNLFKSILSSNALPVSEKRKDRIAQEGFVAIAAGGETTGRVLTNATYHLLADEGSSLLKLQEELLQVMPDPEMRIDVKRLEQLPWLVGPIPSQLHEPYRGYTRDS